jgi:hypothetical protein
MSPENFLQGNFFEGFEIEGNFGDFGNLKIVKIWKDIYLGYWIIC